MSVRAISRVLEHSAARGGARLVLLSIANRAHDDGSGAWPSIRTIAHEANLSERQVRYCLRRLQQMGELRIDPAAGRRGTNLYTVLARDEERRNPKTVLIDAWEGVKSVASPPTSKRRANGGNEGAIHGTEGVQAEAGRVKPVAPEPSLEPSQEPSFVSPLGKPASGSKSGEQSDAGISDSAATPSPGSVDHLGGTSASPLGTGRRRAPANRPRRLRDVKRFFESHGFRSDAGKFFNYYEARGWRCGDGQPVQRWQALAKVWEANEPNVASSWRSSRRTCASPLKSGEEMERALEERKRRAEEARAGLLLEDEEASK
jgi:hypothetical protein